MKDLFDQSVLQLFVDLLVNNKELKLKCNDEDGDGDSLDIKIHNALVLDIKLLCYGLWMNLLSNHSQFFLPSLVKRSSNVQKLVDLLANYLDQCEEVIFHFISLNVATIREVEHMLNVSVYF